MEEQEFIDFIDKAYAKGRAIEDVTKKLKDSGFDQTYIDLAKRHYDSKKKVKTEPAKGSELPSMPGEKTTSSAPKSKPQQEVQMVDPKQIESIKLKPSEDTPSYLQDAKNLYDKAAEIKKESKKAKDERESLAFSISETISKDSLDLGELNNLYSSYKSKAPELAGVELFDESGQINKTFIDVVSSDYESYYNKSLAEILKKEGVKTEGTIAGMAKEAGNALLGFVALGEQLLKESGGLYRRSAADELAYEELEKAGYAPKAGIGSFTPPSIQKITSEYTEERNKVRMLRQLEKGYSVEQITKGAMQTAIQDKDWGLVGMAMIEQIPQLIYPIISKKHGLKILAGMAAGGAYADVIDDEDFGAYKTTYAVLMGLAEGLTSKIGMTDVNQVRRFLGDTSKEALEKSVISKTLFKWIPDTGFSGVLKSGGEEAFEEALVGLVDESMKTIIAGKKFDPNNIAEGAMIGGSFGMSVDVATRGTSALLRSTMSKDYIKIKDRIGQINELLKDESISETEREVLAKELGKYKSDIRKMENDTQKFYEGFSKEDVQETVRLNQRINDGLESYKESKTQIAKEAALRSVKEAVEAKKNIEGKYTAEPSVSVVGKAKSIKVGSKVTSANVNMIIDGFSGFIDRLSPETLGVSKTTADQAKRGLKSIKNVVESFVKEGKEVDIVVHQDADSFVEATGEKESRGIHITKDGAANQIHLLAPALKDNTVYHEAIHEAIPNIYGKRGVDKLAEKFFNALKANPELFVKLSGFLAQYKSGEVMDWTKLNDAQKDELITELGAMIASGDIDVEVKSSIGSAFVSAITELMGKMGFNVKPTTQQLVNALNFVSNNLATGKAVGEARAKKTAGTPSRKGDVATVEEGAKKQDIVKTAKVKVSGAPDGNYINVGMEAGTTKEPITTAQIKSALPSDMEVQEEFVKEGQKSQLDGQENEEPTMVLKLSRPLTDPEMQSLLDATDQLTIAALYDGTGQMFGSDRWNDFDPQYFSMLDGKNLSELKAVETAKKVELAEDGAPVSKNIDNPSDLISKKRQGYGNELVNIEIEHTEKNKLEQYEKEGIVRYVDDLSFLKDSEVVTITPDDMAVSTIKKNGKTIHETGGGVFFVLKYSDIWAFSKASVAKSVTRVINEQVEKNGISYLVLVKGTDSKMMSSPQGAKAALLAVEALSDAGIVSAKDLAIAFERAVAASKGNFVIPDSESAIKSAIENYFEDPTQSTFQRRGDVVRKLISEIGKTKTGKANAKEIQKFFGGDASKKLSFSNSKNWDDGGSELLKNLIGRMFAEPITHGLEKSSLYAVIPITSKVEFFKSSHKSYPFHLRFEDLKTKPTLVIPKDRPRGDDYMTSIGGGTAKELGKSFPGAVLGDISKGWGQGVVKPPVKSEGKKKAQAIAPETSANYANMTEDGKGNFVFYHFSDQNFDAPDPNMAGKNKRGVTSREEAQAMNTAGAVAMYYTDAMDREGLISADYGYEVRVPIERVYDIDADPLSLEKEAMERFKKENPNLGFSGNHRAFAMTAIAAEKGFDVTVGAWTKGLSRAHSAVKLPVSDRMINKGKEKKKFSETFESNKGSWTGESPDRAMGPVKDVYTKISMERSETSNYDDLYRLYYEYRNYSQQEITDMINSSNVSAELKAEYKKALDAVPSGYQSVKKQGADKKRSQGFLETEAKLYLLDMSDYDEATNSFKPKMTEDDFVGLMSMTLTEQTARDVYRSVEDGSGISDVVGQAYANYLQDIEKLNERDKITMANIDKWLLDSQADLKKVLKDAGLANAYSLLVTRAGHGSIAKFFYNQYEKDVYNGLSKEEVEELDKIIFARRVIQIDTNFDNRGEKRPDHPLGMNKESASVSLKASEVRNKADFNRLNQRADAYFDAFRAMLLRAKENELINEEDYNHFVNFDYQPRFFLSHLFEDFDSLPSDMRVSTNKELIAKIKSGSQESAMMDSRFLMAAYASSMEARIAKNKVNKSLSEAAVGNKNSEWIREDGTKDTRGFQEITYFDDGVKKKFYLRNDLKNALDNVPLSSPEFSRGASILSGSAFLKVAATATNPLFVLKNIPRDYNHVLFLTDTYDNSILPVSAFKLTMDFMKGWGSAKDSQNELYKDWILHGGGMEFLAVQGKPNLTSKAGKAISDAFSYLGEKSEMSFRIGVYSRQLDRAKQKYKDLNNGKEATGRDLEEMKVEAARQSREIIDFAQGGSFVKAAEAYTPYINAAFQGFRVSKNYIKENPLMFGAKLAQAFVGLTGLALLNLSYDDDDITDINEEIRRRNFILLLPFKIKNDKGELQRAYIPIAKTQQLQAFLNPLEQMSYKLAAEINGKEPIDYYSKDLLDISVGEVLESFLPVNPTDLADLYTRVPMANAVYKYNTNYDKFRKQEISYDYGKVEPKMEGINDKTVPYFYKAFGQITEMSPKRLQAGIESVITSPNSSLPVGIAYFMADASARMVNVPYKGEYQEIDMRDASFPALTGLMMSTRKVAIRTIDPNTTPSGLKERLRSINEVAGSSRKEINFLADKITEEMRKEEYSQEAFKKWRDEAVKLLGTVAKKSPTEIKYAESVLMNSLKKKKYDRAFDEIKYSTNHVGRAKVLDEIIKSGGYKDLAELEKEMYYSGNGYKIPQETYYEYKKITK
jgi:hypothetical protein